MSPEELALYALTAFDLGDLVEIDDSDIVGEVIGFTVVIGDEDKYLIAYQDNCGNPQRNWWPASALDAVDEPPRERAAARNNIIQFPRAATRH